jgi:hypothetical protein
VSQLMAAALRFPLVVPGEVMMPSSLRRSAFSGSFSLGLSHASSLFFWRPALSLLLIASIFFFVGAGSCIFVYVPPHEAWWVAHQASYFPGGRFMLRLTRPK